MDLIIRKALTEDACDYADCHISCWKSAYKGIVPDDFLHGMREEREQRTERYKNAFTNPDDGEYYCVVIEDRIVGFSFVNRNRDEDKPLAGEVIAIYLLEEFWDKGHGRKLMDHAVERLRSMGCNEAILWTFEDNTRARRFYEKYGFVFDGAKKEMTWGKPLTLVRYVLTI